MGSQAVRRVSAAVDLSAGTRWPHLVEVGPWGLRPTTYDDLEIVAHWRGYLDAPMRYLRHVL